MDAVWFLFFIIPAISTLAASNSSANDFPPVDTSSIDSLIQKLGGKIPFPPELLLQDIQAGGGTISGLAVIPEGRSLERRITSFSQPRTIFSVNFGEDSNGGTLDPSKDVFIAYTPANHELQMIGASSKKPFDFRTVENYQASNPHPQAQPVSNPGLCYSCHQNGAAIFPKFPWSETQENPDIVSKVLAQKNLDPFAKFVLTSNSLGQNVATSGSSSGGDLAYGLNNEIDAADQFERVSPAGLSSMCENICGKSLECRKVVLMDAILSANSQIPETYFSQGQLKNMVSTLDQNTRRDFIIASYDLLFDRNPIPNPAIAAGPGNDPLTPRPGQVLRSPGTGGVDILDTTSQFSANIIGSNYYDGKVSDVELGIASVAQLCITFTSGQQKELTQKKIANAYKNNLFDKILLDPIWPPTGGQILIAIAGKNGHVDPNLLPGYDTADRFSPSHKSDYSTPGSVDGAFNKFMALRTGTASIPHTHTGQLYTAYCASCHAGPNAIAPVLPLGDMAALKTYVGAAGRTVQSMLEPPGMIMPPPGSPLMPSAQDRVEMLNAVGAVVTPATLAEIASQSCSPSPSANTPTCQATSLAPVQQSANFGVCMGCHSSGPGPHIPFGDPTAFKYALRNKATFSSGTIYDAIIQRINDPTTDPNHMPMGGQLTNDERNAISSYLKSMIGQ